jgi:hypothetical protein
MTFDEIKDKLSTMTVDQKLAYVAAVEETASRVRMLVSKDPQIYRRMQERFLENYRSGKIM